jgi:hypothetical protein
LKINPVPIMHMDGEEKDANKRMGKKRCKRKL